MTIYDTNHRFRPNFPDFVDILRTISIGHINPSPSYFVNLTAKLLDGIWQLWHANMWGAHTCVAIRTCKRYSNIFTVQST